jgi:hypothetical protein
MGERQMGDCAGPKSGIQILPVDGQGQEAAVVEESQWKQMAEAVARVMWPAAEES